MQLEAYQGLTIILEVHKDAPITTPVSLEDKESTDSNNTYSENDVTSSPIDPQDNGDDNPEEQDIIPGQDHHAIHGGRSGKQDTLF